MDWIDEVCEGWAAGVATAVGAVIIWFAIQAITGLLMAFWPAPAHANERGVASVYSQREGKWTASGERMRDSGFTAAHNRLPFGTHVLVKHGSRSVVVRINDRGPHVKRRIIDLSPAAAHAIGLSGLDRVELQVLN